MILFAYAGNMNVEKFAQTVPSARKIDIGKLPGYDFIFNTTADDESSKANVMRSSDPDALVWGILIAIEDHERSAFYYPDGDLKLEEVICLDSKDNIHHAEVFTALPHAVNTHLLPYDWYHQKIMELASDAGLPPDYINQISLMPFKADPDERRRIKRLARL